MFKIRDGPLDYYFCDEECAMFWSQYRHVPGICEYLHKTPQERGDTKIETVVQHFFSNSCSDA